MYSVKAVSPGTQIDDYTKDGGPGAVWIFVVLSIILCGTNFSFGKIWR